MLGSNFLALGAEKKRPRMAKTPPLAGEPEDPWGERGSGRPTPPCGSKIKKNSLDVTHHARAACRRAAGTGRSGASPGPLGPQRRMEKDGDPAGEPPGKRRRKAEEPSFAHSQRFAARMWVVEGRLDKSTGARTGHRWETTHQRHTEEGCGRCGRWSPPQSAERWQRRCCTQGGSPRRRRSTLPHT